MGREVAEASGSLRLSLHSVQNKTKQKYKKRKSKLVLGMGRQVQEFSHLQLPGS